MCISTPLPLTVFPRSSSSHILTKTVLYHFMRLAMYCGFLLSLSKINSLSSFLLMTSIISLCFLPFFLCLSCFYFGNRTLRPLRDEQKKRNENNQDKIRRS